MEDRKVLTTLEEIKAISDPFRYRILNTLIDMNEPATVKQIADKMKEVPSKIYYHVNKLEKVGIVKLTYTKKIKGVITKYYEPLARKFEIKCSKEIEEPSRMMLLAVSQMMISEFYDNSKDIFLNSMDKNIQESNGTIISKSVYLTGEETEEIIGLMKSFFKKHKEEDCKKTKYHSFFTIIEE